MAIETGLRTLLLSQSSIVGIAKPQEVDGCSYQGVFNEHPVQGFKPPFVLISQITLDPLKALDGTYGLRFTDFDFDCYSRDYTEAVALGKIVEEFLDDYSGSAGPDDTIKAVLFNGKRYDEVFEQQGGDQRQHIISLSFNIQHQSNS